MTTLSYYDLCAIAGAYFKKPYIVNSDYYNGDYGNITKKTKDELLKEISNNKNTWMVILHEGTVYLVLLRVNSKEITFSGCCPVEAGKSGWNCLNVYDLSCTIILEEDIICGIENDYLSIDFENDSILSIINNCAGTNIPASLDIKRGYVVDYNSELCTEPGITYYGGYNNLENLFYACYVNMVELTGYLLILGNSEKYGGNFRTEIDADEKTKLYLKPDGSDMEQTLPGYSLSLSDNNNVKGLPTSCGFIDAVFCVGFLYLKKLFPVNNTLDVRQMIFADPMEPGNTLSGMYITAASDEMKTVDSKYQKFPTITEESILDQKVIFYGFSSGGQFLYNLVRASDSSPCLAIEYKDLNTEGMSVFLPGNGELSKKNDINSRSYTYCSSDYCTASLEGIQFESWLVPELGAFLDQTCSNYQLGTPNIALSPLFTLSRCLLLSNCSVPEIDEDKLISYNQNCINVKIQDVPSELKFTELNSLINTAPRLEPYLISFVLHLVSMDVDGNGNCSYDIGSADLMIRLLHIGKSTSDSIVLCESNTVLYSSERPIRTMFNCTLSFGETCNGSEREVLVKRGDVIVAYITADVDDGSCGTFSVLRGDVIDNTIPRNAVAGIDGNMNVYDCEILSLNGVVAEQTEPFVCTFVGNTDMRVYEGQHTTFEDDYRRFINSVIQFYDNWEFLTRVKTMDGVIEDANRGESSRITGFSIVVFIEYVYEYRDKDNAPFYKSHYYHNIVEYALRMSDDVEPCHPEKTGDGNDVRYTYDVGYVNRIAIKKTESGLAATPTGRYSPYEEDGLFIMIYKDDENWVIDFGDMCIYTLDSVGMKDISISEMSDFMRETGVDSYPVISDSRAIFPIDATMNFRNPVGVVIKEMEVRCIPMALKN